MVSEASSTSENPFRWLSIELGVDPTPIEVPVWVPKLVRDNIFFRFRGPALPSDVLFFKRVLNSQQLKEIIRELSRKSKNSSAHESPFYHPVRLDLATLVDEGRWDFDSIAEVFDETGRPELASRVRHAAPPAPGPEDWTVIQALAVIFLIEQVRCFANPINRVEIILASEKSARDADTGRIAKPLRDIASELKTRGMSAEAEALESVARSWERRFDSLNEEIVLFRPGKKYSKYVRGAVIYCERVTRQLFEMSMPAIVAKLANLADPEINLSPREVERILKKAD